MCQNALKESGAVSLLMRAVELDNEFRYEDAIINYESALEIMLKVMKETKNDKTRNELRIKFGEYMERAESIKKIIRDRPKSKAKQIQIQNDDLGFSYKNIFGPYLDKSVTQVDVDDPYIRNQFQIINLIRFCELLITTTQISSIILTTGQDSDENSKRSQIKNLTELQSSLENRSIELKIIFSSTLHDREIRLNNGWTFKMGRGLEIFKPPDGKYSIGLCKMTLRRCYETTINIFHKDLIKS